MSRYVKTLRSLTENSAEVSPETLRGFALGSDLRSRRLVKITTEAQTKAVAAKTALEEETDGVDQRSQTGDVVAAADDANAGLVAVALRKLSSRQRKRLRKGIWRSAER